MIAEATWDVFKVDAQPEAQSDEGLLEMMQQLFVDYDYADARWEAQGPGTGMTRQNAQKHQRSLARFRQEHSLRGRSAYILGFEPERASTFELELSDMKTVLPTFLAVSIAPSIFIWRVFLRLHLKIMAFLVSLLFGSLTTSPEAWCRRLLFGSLTTLPEAWYRHGFSP